MRPSEKPDRLTVQVGVLFEEPYRLDGALHACGEDSRAPSRVKSIFSAGKSQRKEDKTMHYEKPELVELAAAIAAIQKGGKGQIPVPDSQLRETNGAYEADE